jgi:hypothetical protein
MVAFAHANIVLAAPVSERLLGRFSFERMPLFKLPLR